VRRIAALLCLAAVLPVPALAARRPVRPLHARFVKQADAVCSADLGDGDLQALLDDLDGVKAPPRDRGPFGKLLDDLQSVLDAIDQGSLDDALNSLQQFVDDAKALGLADCLGLDDELSGP
jgi:hypothetical protein